MFKSCVQPMENYLASLPPAQSLSTSSSASSLHGGNQNKMRDGFASNQSSQSDLHGLHRSASAQLASADSPSASSPSSSSSSSAPGPSSLDRSASDVFPSSSSPRASKDEEDDEWRPLPSKQFQPGKFSFSGVSNQLSNQQDSEGTFFNA
jgi:hypothetical protein